MKKFSLLLLLSCLSLLIAPGKMFGAYCTPSYYYASYSCSMYGMDVARFAITGAASTSMNDVSACSGSGYEDLTSTSTTVSMMQSYTYLATLNCTGSYGLCAQVWIDFNNNTTFETSESVGGVNNYYSSTTFNITIPITAAVGSHRMRIVTSYAPSGYSHPSMDPCTSGYNYGDARDYNITIVALPACTGTITAGAATSTTYYACPSTPFTLSLSGSTAASGITYQWQSSPDSATWTNISGATTLSYSLTESATTFYRCLTACTSSSSTSTSTGVKVFYIGGCFCIPYYSSAGASCSTYGMDISNFRINGETSTVINDAAACNGTGYFDRTSLSCDLKQSIVYTTTIACSGSYSLNAQTWIDFNDNGTFETSERVGGLNSYSYRSTFSITVPVTAATGMHRLRVVETYSGATYPSINPCAGYTYGEARDYMVNIVPLPPCSGTPSAGSASASVTLACPSVPFTLTVSSFTAAGSLGFQWQSSPDSSTWTNISGATAPIVNYTASAALYYRCIVTCTVSGSSAISTAVFVNYLGICYCTPSFSLAGMACSTYGMDISQFRIVGDASTVMNDTSNCTGAGYTDLSGTSLVDLMQSVTYGSTVHTTGPTYSVNAQVWIDFNVNGTFETSESVGGLNNISSTSAGAFNITMPMGVSTGTRRMRIVVSYNGSGYVYPTMDPCTSGYNYGEARDYTVNIVPLPPCSGTPNAGTVSSTSATACPSLPFTLSLVGSTVAGSLTYQWQSSPDSATWTNISGATTFTWTLTESSTLYYRCLVTCTVSGVTSSTPGLRIPYYSYCYCVPSFYSASVSCGTYNFALARVKSIGESGTVLHDSAACTGSGYQNRTMLSVTYMQSVSYATTVTANSASSSTWTLNNQVWIDFDDNGTFETSETVGGRNGYTASTVENLIMPLTAVVGSHRMRIVQVYDGSGYSYPTLDPCTSGYSYGEARDYTVNIVPLPPCSGVPTAGTASASIGSACPSLPFTLSLTGYTVAGSMVFQWQRSTDSTTWTNITGATSTTLTTTETASYYYRARVTCTISGSSDSSNGWLVPYVSYCYCIPSFSSATASCSTYNFALSGFHTYGDGGTSILDNAACTGSGYQNLTALTVTFMQTVTYMATIYPSTASSYTYTLNNQIWIDFNDNGTFESSETVAGYNGYSDSGPIVDSIPVPLTATPGVHRMRLVQVYSGSGYSYPTLDPCCSGYYYGEARDYTVNLVPLPACSGMPNAGNAVSSTGTACPSVPFTLSLAGYSLASGLTYQWQVSNDSATWTNITGATTMSTTTTQSAPKYYQCLVTCTASGLTDTSGGVYVNYISYCYCAPSYSGASYACTSGMGTSRFRVPGVIGTSIHDTTTCNGTTNYENNTAMSVTLFQGSTYSVSLTITASSSMCVQAWIDYNNNGTFSTSESVGGYNYFTGTGVFNIVIPGSASLGSHRMRVVTSYAGSGYTYSSLDPCTAGYSFGDARDYTVVIGLPGCTSTPTGGAAVASATIGCSGYTTNLTLSGASTGGGITYQWQSSNDSATWTSITGATSATYTTAVTVLKYYRNILTCATTGTSGTSAGVMVDVYPLPTSITGSPYVCAGSTITMSSTPSGGTWSTTSTSFATVTATTGVVTGVATGTALITYTLPTGCATVGTVVVNPSPASITGTPTVCVGSTTNLYDATVGGTWTTGSAAIASVSSTGVVTGITAGTVLISYTLSTGCSGPSPTTTRSVTVNPLPAAISGSTALCVGYPVTLSSSSTGGLWTSSATSVASIGTTSGVVTGASAGSATITYAISTTGCKTTAAVTVNTVTTPSLSVSETPGTTVCSGTSVTFAAVTVNPGSSPSFVWRVNGVVTGGSSTFTYTPSNGDVVNCWFLSSAVCARPDSMSVSRVMTVNPVVTPSVSLSTGMGDTVCLGTTTTLTASPSGGGTAPTYRWYVNGSVVGSTTGSYSYVPTNGDVVTVRLFSNQVCRAADSATRSKVLTVSANLTPIVSITSGAGPSVCVGTSVTFTASGTSGGTAPSYQWYVNGAAVGTGIAYSYTPANGDSVSVTMNSNFPCVTSATASNSLIMTVLPVTAPVGTLSVAPGYIVAPGTATTFTCTITGGGGSAPTYQWSVNGAPVSGATNTTYVTSSLANGDVIACVVGNTDPCSTISTFASITMTVARNVGIQTLAVTPANISVVPNPNKGVFNIKGSLGLNIDETIAIEITDMLGQVIYRDNIKAVGGEINQPVTLSGTLANGMYLLNVKSEHINKVFHFALEQ